MSAALVSVWSPQPGMLSEGPAGMSNANSFCGSTFSGTGCTAQA